MANLQNKLYRTQALERMSSPDNLELLMPVVRGFDWLMLVGAGAMLALFLAWTVAGRLPTVAAGRGVIVRPRRVVQSQNTAAGRILTLNARAGDRMREGDLIATIDQSELRQRIDEDQRTVETLEQQDRAKQAVEAAQLALQQQQDSTERNGIESTRIGLQRSLAGAVSQRTALETRSARQQVKEGLLGYASAGAVEAESAVRDNEAKIDDYTARLQQIDGQLKQIETRAAELSLGTTYPDLTLTYLGLFIPPKE